MSWEIKTQKEIIIDDFEWGDLGSTGEIESTTKVRSKEFEFLFGAPSPYATTCVIQPPNYSGLKYDIIRYKIDETYSTKNTNKTGNTTITLTETTKIKLVFYASSSSILIPGGLNNISVKIILTYAEIPATVDENFFQLPYYITQYGLSDKYDGSIWTLDENFFQYPYIKKSGIAPEYDGFIWRLDENFFQYPYIKKSGIAPEYEFLRLYKIYSGKNKVQKFFIGSKEVRDVLIK